MWYLHDSLNSNGYLLDTIQYTNRFALNVTMILDFQSGFQSLMERIFCCCQGRKQKRSEDHGLSNIVVDDLLDGFAS